MAPDRKIELQRSIAAAQAELVALQQEEIRSEVRANPVDRIADLLHKKLCKLDHTDQCGWEYPGPKDTQSPFYKKAAAVVALGADPWLIYQVLDRAL